MEIRLHGFERFGNRLQRVGHLRAWMPRALDEAVAYVVAHIPPYPPANPDSRYRRTGTLGRSITGEVRSPGGRYIGVVGTDVVYAPWVISSERVAGRGPQAYMHRGRWWLFQKAVVALGPDVASILKRHIRDRLRSS